MTTRSTHAYIAVPGHGDDAEQRRTGANAQVLDPGLNWKLDALLGSPAEMYDLTAVRTHGARARTRACSDNFDITLELDADPGAARHVRAVLRDVEHKIPAALRHDVLLLIPEVVNNAVLYGAAIATIGVDVTICPESVHVAVTNRGPAFRWTEEVQPEATAVGGRGLLLVEALASACGVERRGHTNRVWFEVAARQPRERDLDATAPLTGSAA